MAKVKMAYKPLSKDEQDKFDKSQQEFYEKYIKYRKENNDEHTATKNADNSITECHNG